MESFAVEGFADAEESGCGGCEEGCDPEFEADGLVEKGGGECGDEDDF